MTCSWIANGVSLYIELTSLAKAVPNVEVAPVTTAVQRYCAYEP